ncbi:MAG TPA: SulP family inorganic anion transporter [Mycobacteriales bacterium]|nr:SulP family inorganic anion transporter [Mycobacteriales bacterium]
MSSVRRSGGVFDVIRSRRKLQTETLAALMVGLALIPEAISFSVIDHVDPRVGLFSAFTMAVSIAFLGGRPAMISAATGSVSLVAAPLAREYGLQYLIAAVLLGGAVQVVLGVLGVAKLMRFVPRSVMIGFVDALGVLLFVAQLPNLEHVPWAVYPLVVAALLVIVGFPLLTKAVPAPLVAVVVLTIFTVVAGVSVPTVGDKGKLPNSLPMLGLPQVPYSLHTLQLIALPAVGMALVGLMESLLTAKLVDDLTDSGSDKTRECVGQGGANLITGFLGGMGGCALIGETLINIRAGARSRLSTFLAGAFLLILVVVLGPVVARIPMAALVGVMFFVSATTFDWHSIRPNRLRRMPVSETAVMVVTVAVTLATGNLAYGVLAGVVTAALVFARRVAHLAAVTSVLDPDGATVVYAVTGQLFFASSNDLADRFDYAGDPDRVVIDLSQAHVWDASSVATLDSIAAKYAARDKGVELIGLNGHSADLHGRLSGHMSSSH